MEGFFNNILNVLIRNVPMAVRITISFVLMVGALVTLILSIRKKNDSVPLSLGWFFLTFVLMGLGCVYIWL